MKRRSNIRWRRWNGVPWKLGNWWIDTSTDKNMPFLCHRENDYWIPADRATDIGPHHGWVSHIGMKTWMTDQDCRDLADGLREMLLRYHPVEAVEHLQYIAADLARTLGMRLSLNKEPEVPSNPAEMLRWLNAQAKKELGEG